MSKDTVFTTVVVTENTTFSLTEVCEHFHIPRDLLAEIIDQGLLANQTTDLDKIMLDQQALHRLEIAFRLHRDLDLNLPGVALALELLEQMDKMRDELEILRRHF